MALNRRGDLAAVTAGTSVTIYRVDTAQPAFPPIPNAVGGWFSDDGDTVALITSGNHVVFIDVATGEQIGPAIPSGAGEPRIDKGGSHFVVQRNTGGQLYDFSSRLPIGEAFPGDGYPVLRPDGRQLVTSRSNGLMFWDLDPDHWEQAACVLAGRNLTRDEWNTLAAARAHDRLHLGCRPRQHDNRRRLAEVRQRIALVRHQLRRLTQHGRVAADAAEFVDQTGVHRPQWYTPTPSGVSECRCGWITEPTGSRSRFPTNG